MLKNHPYIILSAPSKVSKTGAHFQQLSLRDLTSSFSLTVWGSSSFKPADIISVSKFKESDGFLSCSMSDVSLTSDPSLLPLVPTPVTQAEWAKVFDRIHQIMIQESVPSDLIKLWDSLPSKMYHMYKDTPAGAKNHQAYAGGLITHTYHILNMYTALAEGSALPFKVNPFIFAFSALFHDSAKVLCYEKGSFAYTKYLSMINHVAGSADLAINLLRSNKVSEEIQLHVAHCILSHHELLSYGSPVRPSTVEAELLAMLDRISGHGGQIDENATLDGVYIPSLETTVYKYE